MIKQILLVLSLGTVSLVGTAYGFEMKGSFPVTIKTSSPKTGLRYAAADSGKKTVYLMKVNMTNEERRTFFSDASPHKKIATDDSVALPSHVETGMNNVPVLDQGQHGACVTFAVTGAMDALLRRGDHISQLCLLELGNSIERASYLPSGWDGSEAPIVLDRVIGYGIISKDKERTYSCAGRTLYPIANKADTGSAMSPEEHYSLSEKISRDFFWEAILTKYTRTFNDYDKGYNPEQTLLDIKKALAIKQMKRDSRVIFSTAFPSHICNSGACGQHHAKYDSWVLTDTMKNSFPFQALGAHEMIITGYDDNAIAIDEEGVSHQGLLTIRNSWGKDTGDKGDFYMSYEFFKKYVLDVTKVEMGRNIAD